MHRWSPVLAVLAVAVIVIVAILSSDAPPSCEHAYRVLSARLHDYSLSFDPRLLRDLPECR